MTAVTVEHVSKTFRDEGTFPMTALKDVSLKINEGDVLAVLGPSGCGKSTLLRCIAGLIQPDTGRVLHDGVPVQEVERQNRNIGMVFQEGALIPHLEARKSVGFFLSLRKREHEIPSRVHKISKITGFGLDVLLDRLPSKLSGGEKQRVAIARALTRDLDLLLMDEPFANIDAQLRAQARIELKRLMTEFPVTGVYVTHDQVEAVSLARRVAVMDAGRLVQVGTYEQLYHAPVNQFVASFVGTQPINLLHGFAIEGEWKGDSFVGFPIRKDIHEGTRVVLGVRPEHMRPAGDDEAGPVAEGVVQTVTPYYAERYQLLEVRGNGESWTMQVPPGFDVRPKDRIRCVMDADQIMFFDGKTGAYIG